MGRHKNEIELESSEELTDESFEIARVWITNNNGSHVWISAYALDGAKSFGNLMAETIRHGAKAYATTYDLDEAETLQEIVDGVGEELLEQFRSISMISPGGLN
jgi:Domain of unknown function (DUF5076)